MYLGVTFDTRMTWRHHIEMTIAKALHTYIRIHCLFKSGRSSIYIKLMLYKALIRSITTYTYPTWKYATKDHLLILRRLQNRVLRTIGNLDRCTPVREFHVAFKIANVCDYVTKLCETQPEEVLHHVNQNVHEIGQGEARHRKYKGLTNCSFRVLAQVIIIYGSDVLSPNLKPEYLWKHKFSKQCKIASSHL
jgi:hypothetical protein